MAIASRSRVCIDNRYNSIYQTVVTVWLTLSVASVILAGVTWIQLSLKIEEARQAVANQLRV